MSSFLILLKFKKGESCPLQVCMYTEKENGNLIYIWWISKFWIWAFSNWIKGELYLYQIQLSWFLQRNQASLMKKHAFKKNHLCYYCKQKLMPNEAFDQTFCSTKTSMLCLHFSIMLENSLCLLWTHDISNDDRVGSDAQAVKIILLLYY